MTPLTEEMKVWLAKSRSSYEFYLLHAIAHDPQRRAALLGIPLRPEDFGTDECELVFAALKLGHSIGETTGIPMPTPPDLVYLRDHLRVAASQTEMPEEVLSGAERTLPELLDPSYSAQWYCIDTYLEAWLTTARGKRYARQIQISPVADMASVADLIRRDMEAASAAVRTEEDDMQSVLDGTDMEIQVRKSTGIAGLDACLNGGWGEGECYLLFGGTGGGKSIGAAQCGWHEALSGGNPLIVSTELKACEYVARILSNCCSIPIWVLQDCRNFAQMRYAVASRPELSFLEGALLKNMEKIRTRLRIAKVRSDDSLNARSVLEREVARYKELYGVPPSWVCLDWLGTMADVGGGAKDTAARAMAWEMSATGCVKFAEETGIPTLVLAQAVNNAQTKSLLTLDDIGIAKGIGKNMVAVIGITNTIDKAGVLAAVSGKADMPKSMTLNEQLFCVCKARKGEGDNVQVLRNFKYQRFEIRART